MLAVAYRTIVTGADGKDFAELDRRSRRKVQAVAADALLRDLLELEAGYPAKSWQRIANADGKPTIRPTERSSAIDVSLSHSGSLAAAAVTDIGAIGIDIEYRASKRSILEIAAYAFGPRERHIVETAGLRAFYRIWTLREALAKALGVGFATLADRRDYFAEAPDSGEWQSIIDERRWFFSAGDIDSDYAIAVAIAPRGSIPSPLMVRKFD